MIAPRGDQVPSEVISVRVRIQLYTQSYLILLYLTLSDITPFTRISPLSLRSVRCDGATGVSGQCTVHSSNILGLSDQMVLRFVDLSQNATNGVLQIKSCNMCCTGKRRGAHAYAYQWNVWSVLRARSRTCVVTVPTGKGFRKQLARLGATTAVSDVHLRKRQPVR